MPGDPSAPWRDRRGSVAVLFGLLAPIFVLTVAFGVDTTAWYRDALHLQGLADRTAVSAAPLWRAGDRAGALAVAKALVVTDAAGVTLDHAGAVTSGPWSARRDSFEVVLSRRQQHLLAGLFAPGRQSARAVAVETRLVA